MADICTKSKDGRHVQSPRYKVTCLHCRELLPREHLEVVQQHVVARLEAIAHRYGWNVPAIDPDAHLGAIGE
jgi:hypothetical protein